MAGQSSQTSAAPRRRGRERKREILLAAREVFSAKGYENTSVADIAAKVGIVEGAVYKHFATKRDLLFEAMCTFYRPIVEQTREQLAGIQGTRNRLRFIIWRQLRGFAEEPGICRLIIQDIRPRQDYKDSVVHELNRESTSLLLSVIEDAIAAGEFRSELAPQVVRDLIFGGIEHIAWKTLSGRGPLEIDRLAGDLTDFIVRAMDSDGAEPRTTAETRQSTRLQAQVDRLEKLLDRFEARGRMKTGR